MILLPQTLLQIVRAGGSLVIDLKKQTLLPQTLVELARTAAESGATITIKNPNFLLPQTMIEIALAGKGKVVFEL